MRLRNLKIRLITPLHIGRGRGVGLLFLFCPLFSFAQYNIDRVLTAGRAALYYEDYVLSIQYFNQAITAKPFLYEPWFFRGVAKFYLDDYMGAESDCSEAIRLNPYISGQYELRGLCRIRQKNYKGAIDDYDHSIQYDPTSQGLWYNRVLCRIEDKDYEQANADLDSMTNRWKNYAKAWQLKAEVALRQKDTLRAADMLDKALELDEYDGEAWMVRAMISMSRKKWKDADKQLSKAIHLKPSVAGYYINRALSRYNINNLRGAMADYDKALELEPNNFLAHYNRGQLRIQVGDDNRAIDDFNFIIKNEPTNIMAIFNRALLLDRTGDLRGAIRDYSAVIDRFPNFWTGLSYRASCYRWLGMTAKAEMDEFRIFKAQQDKHLGYQPRWSKQHRKDVRKLSDIDMNKYNQLVEEDEQKVEHEYASTYRGKVQNRQVDDEFLPLFTLSYQPHANGMKQVMTFDQDVERFNQKSHPRHRVYVSGPSKTLDEIASKAYFLLLDTLTSRLQESHDLRNDKGLLVERAIAYAATQNQEAAINDLTAYIQLDSVSSLGYWQRAVCQVMINEFSASQGVDIQLKNARALDDFNEALKRSPHNAYLLYNRATFYALRKDYGRAIDDFTQAISQDASFAEAYYNRGLCRLYSGNTAEATHDLSKAGELGLYKAYSILKRHQGAKK